MTNNFDKENEIEKENISFHTRLPIPYEEPWKELSDDHKEYLIDKHGTYKLDPIPSMNDEDPLNWPTYIKAIQLGMLSFHAFSTTFMAAGLIPSFATLLEEFSTSVSACSYFTSTQILVLGIFPLLWVPLMNKYGRLQLLVISALGSCVFNIGCIFSTNYKDLMICRIFGAFFVSPAIAVGGGVVSELTFSHQRGWWTGWWVVGVTLGTHVGPFLMGFVQYQTGNTKYTFVVFAIMNILQFFGYLTMGKETVYNSKVYTRSIYSLFKIRPKTDCDLNFALMLSPFKCINQPKVVIPAIAYSVTFCYANVACGVELTSLFHEKFSFNPQQIGLQFLSLILGCILGEQIGGWVSDLWMKYFHFKNSEKTIEDRLWLSYPGFIIAIVGLIIYGVLLGNITDNTWRFGPLVGLCLASFGLQIITTILVTYAIDSNPANASNIALFITVIRQVFGFVGPFYFPVMLENPDLGIKSTYGILAALVAAFGLIPVALLHLSRFCAKN